MNLTIETEIEEDGRWIAELIELPGVLTYGNSREEAVIKVQSLALRVLAEKLEHQEITEQLQSLFFASTTA